jgi:S-adenosylmethionine synthetase
MAMRLVVSSHDTPTLTEHGVEVVERKGLGHPDTICDALAEQLSVALSRFYLDKFNFILHHNVDKVLLWGGTSRPQFGGGEIIAPMELFLAGRATRSVAGVEVPIEEVTLEATRNWFRDNFHALDPETHIKIHCLLRSGSAELVDLYQRQRRTGVWLANDTSCGVGYAPASALERIVMAVERHINATSTKARYPALGQDVKVMAIRVADRLDLTIACALIGRYLQDLDDYLEAKRVLEELAREAAAAFWDGEIAVAVNTADDLDSGNVYLTVTGTSAEAGDDGQAGRGNRANGLITPYRPMTLEAVAGKNPVTHVGKLYNVAARSIARALVESLEAVSEARCVLVSQIGQPVKQPQIVDIDLRLEDGQTVAGLRPGVERMLEAELQRLDTLWQDVIAGTVPLY